MKKKLDTRFPAARIKKIMQADEDVGKIAQATPVLISKALELFLQNLCGKTYEIMAGRGGKTIGINHLKACVVSNGVFDFLKDVVSRVPDVASEASAEDKSVGSSRRRAWDGQSDDSGSDKEDTKRIRTEHSPGCGRGQGHGKGRGSRSIRSRVDASGAGLCRDEQEVRGERYGHLRVRTAQLSESLNDGCHMDRLHSERLTSFEAVQRPVSSLLSGNGHSDRLADNFQGDGGCGTSSCTLVGNQLAQPLRSDRLAGNCQADGYEVQAQKLMGVLPREALQTRFADNFYQGMFDGRSQKPSSCSPMRRGIGVPFFPEMVLSGVSSECIDGNFHTGRVGDSPQDGCGGGGVTSSNVSPGSRLLTERLVDDGSRLLNERLVDDASRLLHEQLVGRTGGGVMSSNVSYDSRVLNERPVDDGSGRLLNKQLVDDGGRLLNERLVDELTTATPVGDLSCITSCGHEEVSLKRKPRDFDLNMDVTVNGEEFLDVGNGDSVLDGTVNGDSVVEAKEQVFCDDEQQQQQQQQQVLCREEEKAGVANDGGCSPAILGDWHAYGYSVEGDRFTLDAYNLIKASHRRNQEEDDYDNYDEDDEG